ncbi:hypothetical protein [Nocardia africana]
MSDVHFDWIRARASEGERSDVPLNRDAEIAGGPSGPRLGDGVRGRRAAGSRFADMAGPVRTAGAR